ncbi:hypothetical protein J6590_008305 [Homalodisca vitripennis]|nr:hypothetical protein J6590_008305 [Homalodisca vitripennis]
MNLTSSRFIGEVPTRKHLVNGPTRRGRNERVIAQTIRPTDCPFTFRFQKKEFIRGQRETYLTDRLLFDLRTTKSTGLFLGPQATYVPSLKTLLTQKLSDTLNGVTDGSAPLLQGFSLLCSERVRCDNIVLGRVAPLPVYAGQQTDFDWCREPFELINEVLNA